MSEPEAKRPPLTYYINGEGQITRQAELTVREILAAAGFEPTNDYRLTRDEGNHIYEGYDHEIHLHEGERFTATYTGPTPTS